MKKLYFPPKDTTMANLQAAPMSEEEQLRFCKASEDLEERAAKMARDSAENSESVSKKDVVELAKDTYKLTVELFNAKIARGESLIAEEKEIYELCKREVAKYSNDNAIDSIDLTVSESEGQPLGSILGFIFSAVEVIRSCIEQVKDWFNLTTDKDKADQAIVKAANSILPKYGSVLRGFFTEIKDFFIMEPFRSLVNLGLAQKECAEHYQDNNKNVNRQMASDMLDIAEYGYVGHSDTKRGEYIKLSAKEIPDSIRVLYDEEKGLLSGSRGLLAWLGKNDSDNSIVVSYSGTDFRNSEMVYADIVQLSQPSVLYLKAAGLLKLLLDGIPNKAFYVTGHSLGGGLTQFALTANMNQYPKRLTGYGYNPAGLSMPAIEHLEEERLKKAVDNVWIFMTCKDPVSAFGGKIGCLTTLPKTNKNGHGIDAVKECMKKYLESPEPHVLGFRSLTWRCHSDSDFIPYTRTLSLYGDTNYPIFNNNMGSPTTNLISFEVPEALFDLLNIPLTECNTCMGVYNKLNGTAHTVMNRMLLLAANGPIVSNNSIGNIHSSIIYGKYGLGIKEFTDLLNQVYADSGVAFFGSPENYQELLANLHDPIEYDKDAWCRGIELQFGIDMNMLFAQWRYAEKHFDIFLNNVTSDRMDLYHSITSGKEPDKTMTKEFLSGYKDIVVKHAETLMNEAVKYGVFSQDKMNKYMNGIKLFADSVISNV